MKTLVHARRFWLLALAFALLAATTFLFLPSQEAQAGPIPQACPWNTHAVYSYYSSWPAAPFLLVGQKTYYGCGQGGWSQWGQVTRWVTTTCIPCSE